MSHLSLCPCYLHWLSSIKLSVCVCVCVSGLPRPSLDQPPLNFIKSSLEPYCNRQNQCCLPFHGHSNPRVTEGNGIWTYVWIQFTCKQFDFLYGNLFVKEAIRLISHDFMCNDLFPYVEVSVQVKNHPNWDQIKTKPGRKHAREHASHKPSGSDSHKKLN